MCVCDLQNSLRKATFKDYYPEEFLAKDPDKIRIHLGMPDPLSIQTCVAAPRTSTANHET
jgi:hypothetical protein